MINVYYKLFNQKYDKEGQSWPALAITNVLYCIVVIRTHFFHPDCLKCFRYVCVGTVCKHRVRCVSHQSFVVNIE